MKKSLELRLVLSGVLIVLITFLFPPKNFSARETDKKDFYNPESVEHTDPNINISLVATGDVMLGRSVNVQIQKQKNPGFVFEYVSDLLGEADISYINLENPLFDPCPVTDQGMIFCAPASSVKGLNWAGVDVVNLANNHTRNYGQAGYNSTIKLLTDNNILYSDSDNLAIKEVDNAEFGFLGFDLSSEKLPDKAMKLKIQDADNKVDVLVVGFHWGEEYKKEPSDYQKYIAKLAVDAGADLIIGNHPHVVQSIEVYKNVPIVYSLGNFVFDQLWSEETREGAVGIFNFENEELVNYEILPIYINNSYQPEVISNYYM